MKVSALKLSSGEEIIGREVEKLVGGSTTMTMEKVRTIAPQQTPKGEIGIGLMPFCFSQQDGEISISRESIMASFTPDKRLVDVYIEQTTSIKLS